MQSILHATIIALPVAFAALMVLDLISNLKQLWIACKSSTPVSIPASIPQPLPEVAAPATELEELEVVPDPWELEPCTQPMVTTPRLTLVQNNVLLLPPAKSTIEVVEVVRLVTETAKRKPGRPKKDSLLDVEFSVNRTSAPKRRGRPRKTA